MSTEFAENADIRAVDALDSITDAEKLLDHGQRADLLEVQVRFAQAQAHALVAIDQRLADLNDAVRELSGRLS